MQTLIALLVAAAAACAIARPPVPTAASASLQAHLNPRRVPAPPPAASLENYLPSRFLLPHYLGYGESPRVPPPVPENDWLNKEIDRINQMEEDDELINPYEMELARIITQDMYLQGMLDSPMSIQEPVYGPESLRTNFEDLKVMSEMADRFSPVLPNPQRDTKRRPTGTEENEQEHRRKFAYTPMEKEFFDPDLSVSQEPINQAGAVVHHEGGVPKLSMLIEPPRQTRQNPNLSKQKHLVEPDLGKLKMGLANKDYRIPVSLLPTNLRWLKVNQPTDNVDNEESSHEDGDPSKQHQVHMLESASDPADSIYGVALVAAVGAALTMAIFGFAFGWYTLSKKAKAAADVDYPAYGVTGPTMDTSGDRKLAHSAHMYHYQHQKQQIIAMERNGMEQRAGSISDPESEEENEEGDYTVYECPGFATTGDMEVKNPLFSEDPTPATPGKCEMVKPQPKD